MAGAARYTAAPYWGGAPPWWQNPPWWWGPPPYWWLRRHGYVKSPQLVGYPVQSQIAFRNGVHPRRPWPFESETRAAGTGLAMGRLPYPCC